MSDWIKCSDRLPAVGVRVVAKNTLCEYVSWIMVINEIGKPAWCHINWQHADDFVTHWREI